jgi:outer membrane protein assembly factor BamB
MKKTFVLLAGLAAALASAHPWSCFHGDPQHTGGSQSVVGAPLYRAAAYCVGGEISGSPVVRSDGNVLVGARDVKLYCLDANLNTAVWVADLTPYGSRIYFSAPAFDDSGNAYITTNRKLVKVSSSGAVLWVWPGYNALSISHSPVVAPNGDIFFACYSETLYAVKPDGTLDWARDLENSVNSAPAISPDGHVYVATTRDTSGWSLWAWTFDGMSGWQMSIADEADFASPAAAPDSTVYFGAERYLYAVGPGGAVKWRDSLSASIQCCPAIANGIHALRRGRDPAVLH